MPGIAIKDEPLLVWDSKARFVGQEVAAVAAINVAIAREALDLIRVYNEELPPQGSAGLASRAAILFASVLTSWRYWYVEIA